MFAALMMVAGTANCLMGNLLVGGVVLACGQLMFLATLLGDILGVNDDG